MKLNKAEKVNVKKQHGCPDHCETKEISPVGCKACKTWLKSQKTNYTRMTRFFRKELVKSAKQFEPYDYGFLVSLIHIALSYMEAYYDLGYNVFSTDDRRLEIQHSLNEVLDLIEASLDDDLSELVDETLESYIDRYGATKGEYQLPYEEFDQFATRFDKIKNNHDESLKKAFTKMGEDISTWTD